MITDDEFAACMEFRNGRFHALGVSIMQTDGALPSVKPGTPQWQAWRNWFRENGIPHRFMDRQEAAGKSWTVVSEFPPMDGGDALLESYRQKGGRGRLSSGAKRKLVDAE